MVCTLNGPDCRGDVRQYQNWRACDVHTPAAAAGHPEPPTPDPTLAAAHLLAAGIQAQQERAAELARQRNDGMALLRQASEAGRDQAMTQVDQAATDEWKDHARRAVWWCANHRATFNVDDVWDRLEATGVPSPPEPRALGPVLMRAVRAGAIRDTGQMDKSRRRHASKITRYTLNQNGATR